MCMYATRWGCWSRDISLLCFLLFWVVKVAALLVLVENMEGLDDTVHGERNKKEEVVKRRGSVMMGGGPLGLVGCGWAINQRWAGTVTKVQTPALSLSGPRR